MKTLVYALIASIVLSPAAPRAFADADQDVEDAMEELKELSAGKREVESHHRQRDGRSRCRATAGGDQ